MTGRGGGRGRGRGRGGRAGRDAGMFALASLVPLFILQSNNILFRPTMMVLTGRGRGGRGAAGRGAAGRGGRGRGRGGRGRTGRVADGMFAYHGRDLLFVLFFPSK